MLAPSPGGKSEAKGAGTNTTYLIAGLITVAILPVIAMVAGWKWGFTTPESFIDKSILQQLPAPQELAPVSLPHFHHGHPRLPAPSAVDLARLQKENSRYLSAHKAGD
jgi:hypothetical protein